MAKNNGSKKPRTNNSNDAAKNAAEAAERANGALTLEGSTTDPTAKPFDLPLVDITDEFNVIWRARNDYPFIGILVASRRLLDSGTFTSSGKIKDKEGKLRDHLILSTKDQWMAVKASIDANRAARPVTYEEFLDAVENLIYTLGEVQKRNPWGVDFTAVRTQVKDVQSSLQEAKAKMALGESVDCKTGVAAAMEARNAILTLEITKLENQLVRVGKVTNQAEAVATALEQIGKIGDMPKKRSHLLGAISQIKSLSHEQEQKSSESVALGELPPAPVQEERRNNGFHPKTDRYTGRSTHGRPQSGRYAS
ncbi:MAG: hypothetical protein Q8L47_03690 [bacterium]|nr:hypothetical protein [bacterium]